jgi:hypothetical protein
MDLVGYSRLPIDEQTRVLSHLQEMVAGLADFCRAKAAGTLITSPSGDGMALVFFEDPSAPLRCARELAMELRRHPDIQLRMGLHSGPVYRLRDINANLGVTGGGINVAQRVMDCGDAGHILLSSTVAEFVGQVSEWAGHFSDLGAVSVKHGLKIHLYNFFDGEAGNPAPPWKLRSLDSARCWGRSRRLAVGSVAVALAAGVIIFLSASQPARSRAKGVPVPKILPASATTLAAADALSLIYRGSPPQPPPGTSVPKLQFGLVAKRKGDAGFTVVSDGSTLTSEVDDYRVVGRALSAGYLYIFQVDVSGKTQWLFPQNNSSPFSSGSNPLKTNQLIEVPSEEKKAFFLDNTTGIEHLYLVFSATRWRELERLLSESLAAPAPPGAVVASIQDPLELRTRGIGGTHSFPAGANVPASVGSAAVYGGSYRLPGSTEALESSGSFLVVERWFRHAAEPSLP